MSFNKKIFYIGIVVLVVIIGFLVFFKQKPPVFNAPVYISGDSATLLTKPLYLQGITKNGLKSLSSEQQKTINDFKNRVMMRIASKVPLSIGEKNVVNISISTTTKPIIGSMIVVDQTIFRFSNDELKLISEVLKR
ncbi:MAG: hypothetical protein AAB866_02520 [Patescibacteria group bacterium]